MRLVEELKRRNVIRVAIGYLAVGWLLLQAGSLIFGALDLPNSWVRGLLAVLAVGFIPALIFAWVYELTPEGLKRTREVCAEESVSHLTGRKLDYIVIGVLAAVVGLLLLDKFVVTPRQAARPAEHQTVATAAAKATTSDSARADAPPPADSIAVLPFVDMSQAKDQEYFSDGLSEELLDLLAKVPQLKVIARTSSFSFKGKNVDVAEIAKKLAVATVLEGACASPAIRCVSPPSLSARSTVRICGRKRTIANSRTSSRCRTRSRALSWRR
jgi:Predicted integral membrane protein